MFDLCISFATPYSPLCSKDINDFLVGDLVKDKRKRLILKTQGENDSRNSFNNLNDNKEKEAMRIRIKILLLFNNGVGRVDIGDIKIRTLSNMFKGRAKE